MTNSSDYYYDKGLTFLNEGNYDEALMYIDKAIEMDKEIADYWFSKVKCLTELEMYDDALKCFDEAIKFNPNDDSIKNNKVDLLCKQADKLINDGKFKEPLKLYDEALKLVPENYELKYKKVELLCNHANELVKDDKFKEPLKLYDEALKLVPDNETVRTYKVNLLTKQANKLFEEGNLEMSSKYWDKLIKFDSGNPSHYYNKANIILEESKILGNYLVREKVRLTEDRLDFKLISNYLKQARRLIGINNFTQAVIYLAKTDKFEEDMSINTLSEKAALSFKCGCFDDSIRCLDKALFELENKDKLSDIDENRKLEFLNNKVQCLNYKNLVFESNAQYEEGIKCLDEAMSIFSLPDDHYGLLLKNKAVNHVKLSQYKEALNCYEEALNCYEESINDRNYMIILSSKCATLINLKRFDEALNIVDYVLESEPNNVLYLYLKISLLFLTNEIDSAIELCEQTIEQYPDLKYKFIFKIRSLNNIKSIRNALDYVNKSLELDGNNEEIITLKNKLELEEVIELIEIDVYYALECFNKLKIDENNIHYLYCKSRIFEEINNLVKSEECIIKTLELID